MDVKCVDTICDKYGNRPDQLIGILLDVQSEYRYLPKHPLERVSEKLNMPLSQIYAVATFFGAFSLIPKGEKIIQVCMGTACHVRAAQRVLDELSRDLSIEPGNTTDDKKFTLETVNCVGACALGPVVMVEGEYHGKMDTKKSKELIGNLRK